MPDIKAIKRELLTAAGGSAPPASFVRQEDIMDMMISEYFNTASKAPKEMTLNALSSGLFLSKGDAQELPVAEIKKILDKYKPA